MKKFKVSYENHIVHVYSHGPCPDGAYGALFAEMAMKPAVKAFKHITVQPDDEKKWPEPDCGSYPDDPLAPTFWVFFVDVAPTPELLLKFWYACDQVVVLDHHDTAIANYDGFDMTDKEDTITLILDGSRAAASIALEYFSKPANNWAGAEFSDDLRRRAELVGLYDTWKFETGDDVHLYNIGLRQAMDSYVSIKKKDAAKIMTETPIDEMIRAGAALRQFQTRGMEGIVSATKHTLWINGTLICAVLKVGSFNNSDVCEYVSQQNAGMPSLVASVNFDTAMVRCSIRCQNDNIRHIAEKFGGGGHDHAAGFECSVAEYRKYIKNTSSSIVGSIFDL